MEISFLHDDNPAINIAIDEAMLEFVEPTIPDSPVHVSALLHRVESLGKVNVLRLWELSDYCVVMGRGSKMEEVLSSECAIDNVPVVRRCSGGSSIVAGPGCLMYSLRLSLIDDPQLRSIDYAHRWVMGKIHRSLLSICPNLKIQGICDLTMDDRKVSGNAVRFKRDWLLYHGTLLYKFDLSRIQKYLAMPPRHPAYRTNRPHYDFVDNINCSKEDLISSMTDAFGSS